MRMRWEESDWLIERALEEDGAHRDVTTDALVDAQQLCEAEAVVKAEGVVCGLPLAERVARLFDSRVEFRAPLQDGSRVRSGTTVAVLSGRAASILKMERTLLNFLQRLSGIATLTRRFCDAVAGTGAEILDTRKTTPGWRALEKYAVRCGGGRNHRMGLSDQVLIKDNHLDLLAGSAGGRRPIREAVRAARDAAGDMGVQVELDSLEELADALEAGADIVLLDNMTPEEVRRAAEAVRRAPAGVRRPLLEASGGITLGNIRAYAEAGADRISIGALTHSAPALDISLVMRPLSRSTPAAGRKPVR